MVSTLIEETRKSIMEILSKYKGKEAIKLELDGEKLQKILFEVCTDINTNKKYYMFWEPFKKTIYMKK